MFRTLVVVLVGLALLGPGSALADPQKVKIWASGTSAPSNAANTDGSLEPGFHSYLDGGGNLGPFTLTNSGELTDWDGVTFCDFDPDSGFPIAVEIYYVSNSSVLRTQTGDQLFLELNTSQPAPLCFNFNDGSSTFEINADVVGGSGRFAGATGSLLFIGNAQALQNLTPFELTATGTIDYQD